MTIYVEHIRELDSNWSISWPFQVVFSWKKTCDITYFLEGSHLSYPELNNCVREEIIIISENILCRIFIH